MSIKIIVTGGTLDKCYNPLNGELDFTQSHIAEMLQLGRVTLELNMECVMLKDSLQMNDGDRSEIIDICIDTDESQILITHGTDTMVETGKAIASAVKTEQSGELKNKTIVMLGAMIPFEFKDSDALFNLGCAMSAVQILPAGIYITMNGRVFPYDKVVKNTDVGQFEAL
jgi:L-asparaginase